MKSKLEIIEIKGITPEEFIPRKQITANIDIEALLDDVSKEGKERVIHELGYELLISILESNDK